MADRRGRKTVIIVGQWIILSEMCDLRVAMCDSIGACIVLLCEVAGVCDGR